jgi:hypothetical protein
VPIDSNIIGNTDTNTNTNTTNDIGSEDSLHFGTDIAPPGFDENDDADGDGVVMGWLEIRQWREKVRKI